MFPILIKIGSFTIHTYGFFFALGVGLGMFLSIKRAKAEGINTDKFSDLIFWTIISGLIGSKLLLIATNPEMLKYKDAFVSILRSGGTFYGGILIGVPFAILYAKWKKLQILKIADIVSPFIAMGHGFGRLGCFSAGCCYGRPTDSPIGVVFTSPIAHETTGVPIGVKIYPTQLMESILNFFNFFILLYMYKKRKFEGEVFFFYILNYSIIRFFLEYFRGDPDRGYLFGGISHPWSSLSIPQAISIVGFSISLFFIIKGFKKSSSKL